MTEHDRIGARARGTIKLWFQALVPQEQASNAYYASLASHVNLVKRSGTEVVLHGMPARTLPKGMSIAAFTQHMASELIQDLFMAERVLHATKTGFDGFLISPLQAPGLEAARTLTEIPVVGYAQAAGALGPSFGSRLGVIGFNERLLPLFVERIAAHAARPCIGYEDVKLSYAEVLSLFDGPERMEAVVAACRRLIDRGADVIVPGQMILAEGLWANGFHRIDDVPILDALGALVLLGETMVILRRQSAMVVNRRGYHWAMASDGLKAAVAAIGGKL